MMNTFNNANTFDNKLSVYIPRITSEWADEAMIAQVFHANELGVVERVDIVYKPAHNEAFVHMSWFDCPSTRNIQERIKDPSRQARLVHDDPNYWLLLENKNPMTATEVRLEKRIMELEAKSNLQTKVEVSHLNRIMCLETQMSTLEHQVKMNYWNDPTLNAWTASASASANSEIAPLWCHPVNEPTPTPTPSWCEEDVTSPPKTMESYTEDAQRFHEEESWNYYYGEEEGEENVCDYYDYDPYDMEILE